VLLNFFLCVPNFFKISSIKAPKNKSKHRALSVVVLMRGCSGTGEYEAGKEKNHSIPTTKN